MRRLILPTFASVVVALGVAGPAMAGGKGNACPKGSNTPPNCGKHNGQGKGHGGGGGGKACGFKNPPNGPISGITGKVGVAVGDNAVGNLVVDVSCALKKNLGV